jgi:hypothetical protein
VIAAIHVDHEMLHALYGQLANEIQESEALLQA